MLVTITMWVNPTVSYSSSFPDGMMNDKDVMKLIEEESLKIIEGQ